MKLNVLIACEFSGTVRDAFRKLGHDAWSCDVLPTEKPGPHFQEDVRKVLKRRRWDLLIAHPPCTYLTNSSVRWLYGGKGKVRDPKRWALMEEGAEFFMDLWDARVPHIAVENPIPHGYAQLPPYSQIIQPHMFGHGETKATCLWLKDLPLLLATKNVPGRVGRVHNESPGPNRWKNRSRTYPGIAQAMATQWSNYILQLRQAA